MNNIAQRVVLQLLRAYKWGVSPMLAPACRYVPTCSEYAMEAVERYGAWRGGWMALIRLLRCHPFVKGGYDPVVGQVVDGSQSRKAQLKSKGGERMQALDVSRGAENKSTLPYGRKKRPATVIARPRFWWKSGVIARR